MHIKTTTDPISGNEVSNPEKAPCVYDGDGDNGLEIYFESEPDRQAYLALGKDHRITLQANDIDEFVEEG